MEKTAKAEIVQIDGLSHDGRGVGRIEGKTIFVENALPGQKVRATVEKEKSRFSEGKVLSENDVLEKSPEEIEAPCPHATLCGGCPWMKLPYNAQQKWKQQLVADALTRIGKIPLPKPVTFHAANLTQLPLRNKMEFAFGNGEQGLQLGLRTRASHSIVDVTSCLLQSQQGQKALAYIRKQARELATQYSIPAWDAKTKSGFWRMLVLREAPDTYGEARIIAELITAPPQNSSQQQAVQILGKNLLAQPFMRGFVHSTRTTASDIAYGENIMRTLGETRWEETVNLGEKRLTLNLAHNAFYQVNSGMAEKIYFNVIQSLGKYGPYTSIWDVYSGIGGFGLSAAALLQAPVHGFESVEESVNLAKENASKNALTASFTQKDAASLKDRLAKHKPDLVIADPPRAGMDEAFTKALLQTPPRILALVSCNPATLARDAALLSPSYKPVEIALFDMFPYSQHVESVLLLQRL